MSALVMECVRKGFADAGGNPEELKLFINDYNLETAYDQNTSWHEGHR